MTTLNLLLRRTYDEKGVNGRLTQLPSNEPVCKTIELPWRDNQPRVSCIPEGKYRLTKRYSQKHGWHLLVNGVPGRSLILLHPANSALRELNGCIAPVTTTTAPGYGNESRKAVAAVTALAFPVLEKDGEVWLTIVKG